MCFFPGTEASIGGRRPDIWLPYSKAASLVTNDRVDLVLSWLNTTNDAQRPRMLGIYFSIVDSVGHGFGPRSPQVDNALAEVDAGMARLFAGLAALGIDDQVNVVVVSDHGMTENSEERVADLSQIIDPSRVTYSGGSPVIQVYPHDPADTAAIFEGLYAARDSHHMTILLKEQLPPHLHYLNNGRIAPIIAIADFQYALWTSDLDRYVIKGQHGYDANEPDMHAIFYAHGPAFKKGKDMTANSTIPFTLPAFQNIEVYNVLARALGVDPAPNNGTLPVLPSIAQAMTV